MPSDTETHHALISGLKSAMGKGDGPFEQAVTRAFENVFAHLERVNAHVSRGGPEGQDRSLKPGESPTLR